MTMQVGANRNHLINDCETVENKPQGIKRHSIRVDVVSGNTTGTFGAISVVTSLGEIIRNTKESWKESSNEGKFSSILDILKLPPKLAISIIGLIKATNSVGLIVLGVITTTILLPITLICGIAFLSFMFLKSIIVLSKSNNFGKKRKIQKTLDLINKLTLENFSSRMQELEQIMQRINGSNLEEHKLLKEFINKINQENNNPTDQQKTQILNKLKALLIYKKINELHDAYVKRGNESNIGTKHIKFFQRRIGTEAANTFKKASENIKTYDLNKLQSMQPVNITDFVTKGTNILKLVNLQRKKVLKIHMYSLVVLTIGVASLLLSCGIFGLPILALTIGLTVLATATSSLLTVANDSYINHTGQGFNLRLAIPYSMARKKDESNFQTWRHATNAGKVGLVVLNIFTLGIPAIYDGIAKSKWITKLRNGNNDNKANGNSYDKKIYPKAIFNFENELKLKPFEPITLNPPGQNENNGSNHPGDDPKHEGGTALRDD